MVPPISDTSSAVNLGASRELEGPASVLLLEPVQQLPRLNVGKTLEMDAGTDDQIRDEFGRKALSLDDLEIGPLAPSAIYAPGSPRRFGSSKSPRTPSKRRQSGLSLWPDEARAVSQEIAGNDQEVGELLPVWESGPDGLVAESSNTNHPSARESDAGYGPLWGDEQASSSSDMDEEFSNHRVRARSRFGGQASVGSAALESSAMSEGSEKGHGERESGVEGGADETLQTGEAERNAAGGAGDSSHVVSPQPPVLPSLTYTISSGGRNGEALEHQDAGSPLSAMSQQQGFDVDGNPPSTEIAPVWSVIDNTPRGEQSEGVHRPLLSAQTNPMSSVVPGLSESKQAHKPSLRLPADSANVEAAALATSSPRLDSLGTHASELASGEAEPKGREAEGEQGQQSRGAEPGGVLPTEIEEAAVAVHAPADTPAPPVSTPASDWVELEAVPWNRKRQRQPDQKQSRARRRWSPWPGNPSESEKRRGGRIQLSLQGILGVFRKRVTEPSQP
eukprot:TRINITY_DN574_c0_g2_i1.p1 TRINITY_DN574_c0_g2~~TRINITY_DN574_c0_g2_i1.p1  ORF type:complete len:522 (-),score=83.22 TRINITY_DN574_c0_g2_i1:1050-2564(-)